jgi:carbon monoxide dehydrogenase subunit G
MELNATYTFGAPIETTWNLLMDTKAIGNCMPGCRGLNPIGDDRYSVELGVTIAAIAGNFKGTVAIEDKMPPNSYTLVVEGTGSQGFVKGKSRMTLAAAGDGTEVRIAAQADVGGMIARVGQRLLEGVARTMTDRFFACLAKQAEQDG